MLEKKVKDLDSQRKADVKAAKEESGSQIKALEKVLADSKASQAKAEEDLIKYRATSDLQMQLAVANAKLTASHLMLTTQKASAPASAGDPATPAAGPSDTSTPAHLFASFFAAAETAKN